jgi:hypothetical protein
MSELTTHRYGGYENLYLTAAEIAARAYNAGLPTSTMPIAINGGVIWQQIKVVINGVLTTQHVSIDANSNVIWRDANGVISNNGTLIGGSLSVLPGGFGVLLYNSANGTTYVSYAPGAWIQLPNFTGKYLKPHCLEHDYYGSGVWG